MKVQQTKKINVSRLVIATLCLSLFLTCNASAADIPELPGGFSVKWDISKKDNLLVQDFIVHAEHMYWVCLKLESIKKSYNHEELIQLEHFLGGSNGGKDGVIIPVVMKIEQIDGDHVVRQVTKEIINTWGMDAHGTYDVMRIIDMNVRLPAGKYRITIRATRKIKLMPDVETFLTIFNRRG